VSHFCFRHLFYQKISWPSCFGKTNIKQNFKKTLIQVCKPINKKWSSNNNETSSLPFVIFLDQSKSAIVPCPSSNHTKHCYNDLNTVDRKYIMTDYPEWQWDEECKVTSELLFFTKAAFNNTEKKLFFWNMHILHKASIK
jgi:hypothetical protein